MYIVMIEPHPNAACAPSLTAVAIFDVTVVLATPD